jgi:aldehyde dehydrogenase (NAD+)
MKNIDDLLACQRSFFASHQTKPLAYRKQQLLKLYDMVSKHQTDIEGALNQDLGKSNFEAYVSETGFVMTDIKHLIKNLKTWTRGKRFGYEWIKIGPAKARSVYEPLGNCLILAPWNYPVQLTLGPLAGAIAAGNTAVVKFSEYAPATATLMEKLLHDTFDPHYVAVVNGEADVAASLLELRWDMIFFTGSTPVGKKVMAAAAKNLTPVVLELGGKSPVYIHSDANLDVAARRIAWGKYLNAGQTCVAPDYILVHESVVNPLIEKIKANFQKFNPTPSGASDYGKIVNRRHFDRLFNLLPESYQNSCNADHLHIPPTVFPVLDGSHPAMQEELFGPLLPFMVVQNAEDAIRHINAGDKPLALYVFTEDVAIKHKFETQTSSGSLAFNDTVVQISHRDMPFGGVGASGMGRYHGKYTIEAFSHEKAVLDNPTWLDIPMRYPPYSDWVKKWIRKLL